MPDEPTSAERVLAGLAAADHHRRAGSASRALWRAAPGVAAAAVCVAALARWRGWSPVLSLSVLVMATVALLVRTWLLRRRRSVSDAGAAGIDRAAGLGGELRSARWFASSGPRDAWAEYHLDRAAARLATADWSALYPSAVAPRAKAATACLALCAVALAVPMPGRAIRLPSAAAGAARPPAVRPGGSGQAEFLLPDVQKQLEALLAAAEKGTPLPPGAPATAAELRSLITRLNALRDAGKLNELARAMAGGSGGRSDEPGKDLKAMSERARKAGQMPAVAPEVRDTLQKVSDDMADAANAAHPPGDNGGAPVGSGDPQKANTAPGKKGGEVDDASIQSVSEAEDGAGAGIIMMGSEEDAAGQSAPGLGLGGGSDARGRGGRMAELEAALRRETVEASMDNTGDNVQTDARRKTERGQARVTYSHNAAGTFDRARAIAPPAVPERRRAAVQTYFIRPQ